MDKKYITVEGTMLSGNIGKSGYKLKIVLDIYGQPSSREQLAPYLTWAGSMSETGLPPSVPDGSRTSTGVNGSSLSPKKGKGKSRAAPEETEAEKTARRVMEGLKDLEKGGEEKSKDAVMDTLTQGVDILKLPLHPDPPSRRSGHLRNDLLVRLGSIRCVGSYHPAEVSFPFLASSISGSVMDATARRSKTSHWGRTCPAVAAENETPTHVAQFGYTHTASNFQSS